MPRCWTCPKVRRIGELFDKQLPGRRPEDYLIRVDRLPSTRDQVLTPGCRVSITPTKIAGAIRRAISRAIAA